MRYVTHQFAHLETLERARRWLLQVGFDASRIEAHTQGIPRLAVAVEPGEAAEFELVVDAAESTDPDGNPSFWDLARQKHIYLQTGEESGEVPAASQPHTFVIGWRPIDAEREVSQTSTELNLREAYVEQGY
ncbi:MAG: hypothetical protein ACLQIB_48255 [Isosphaeraceae bacterium]